MSTDPARAIFDHWVVMNGRMAARCKFGPVRRQVVLAAMAIGYDDDMLMAAVEGMASDPLEGARDDRMRDGMREIEWLLARESRIERWAERGYRLRQAVAERQRAMACASTAGQEAAPVDRAADDAAREQMMRMARVWREGGHG